MGLTDADRRKLYHYMRLSRAIEDTAWALAGQGRLLGRLYTGHGQEAIPVGAAYALGPDDVAAPMYRDMGVHLVRGVTTTEIFAQYFGKRASANGGRDSGMHIGGMNRGLVGMISVLPDSLPVAVGVALAFKIRREPRVVLTTFGEGATSTGAFHEAVNMAAVLGVPIVLVCENNGWALSTPTVQEYAAASVIDRASGYGIPGVRVDGNDVEAVHAATATAVAHARRGSGPTLIEAVTMRMRGHSMIDPAAYVPRAQLAEWAGRDPLARYRARLGELGLWDDSAEAALEAELQATIQAAVRDASALADPTPADAAWPVFAPDDSDAETAVGRTAAEIAGAGVSPGTGAGVPAGTGVGVPPRQSAGVPAGTGAQGAGA